MVIGSTIAMLWEWRRPRSWEVWGFALAAGLIGVSATLPLHRLAPAPGLT